MKRNRKFLLAILMLLFVSNGLFAGADFKYPRFQNLTPNLNIPGQDMVSPRHPMVFVNNPANAGLWIFLPSAGIINGHYGMHINDIGTFGLSGGYKASSSLFLGAEFSGISLKQGTGYDLSSDLYAVDTGRLIESAYRAALNVAYGFSDKFSLGASLGYLSEGVIQGKGSGFTANVGLVATDLIPNLTITAGANNLGPEIAYTDTSITQPLVISGAIAYDFELGSSTLFPQVSVQNSEKNGTLINAGLGYSWRRLLTLHLGGSFGSDSTMYPWSASIQYNVGKFAINYTYANTESGDAAHLIGLSLQISKPPKRAVTKEATITDEGKPVYVPTTADSMLMTRPGPPRNVRLREEGNALIIEWDSEIDSDRYLIFAKLGEKSVFRQITKTPFAKKEFKTVKPKAEVPLFLYVKTIRGNNKSEPSRVVTYYKD